MSNPTRTAWLTGASGLVGAECLTALLEASPPWQVESFGRRPVDRTDPNLTQHTVDFAHFDAGAAKAPDVALCALGTTIDKAGSKEAFRAVDYDAVLAFAKAARERGANTFVLCSSLSANPKSPVFYSRTKGEIEEAIRALGFASASFVRPSLLLGDRTEHRLGERVAIAISGVLKPLLKPLASRPIEVRTVGRAMVRLAEEAKPGAVAIHSGDLHALGA